MTIRKGSGAVRAVLTFLCGLLPAIGLPSISMGQVSPVVVNDNGLNSKLVYLLQGERRQISDDFVAELDGDTLRVSLETGGILRAGPKDELLVSLIQPSGRTMDMRPNANGEVIFSGVRTGLAAMVITANSLASSSLSSAYAAIPFFVSDAAPAEPGASGLRVPLAEVDTQQLVQDVNQSTQSNTNVQDIQTPGDFEIVKSSRFRVQKMADGSIQGRVIVPQRGYEAMPGVTQLAFYRNGVPAATATSAPDGKFIVRNVPAGINGLVATGPAGHASYAVDIVEFNAEPINPLAGSAKSAKFVSTQAPETEVNALPQPGGDVAVILNVFIIPPAMMDEVRRVVNERLGPQPAPPLDMGAPFAGPGGGFAPGGGGFGGGFGGGVGGGGAGGGGLGGIGGLAALAAIPAIIAATDDDNFFNPIQATRIAPPLIINP